MHKYHPNGRRLSALDQNILKYRAFEMVIILFHIEELKSFVLGAIRATDNARHRSDATRQRLPQGTKPLYEKMWAVLVSDGIVTQEESDDIQEIIDCRNQIGHSIQNLTYDISNDQFSEDYINFKGVQYDYQALNRLMSYKVKIRKELQRNHILPLNLHSLLFDSADYTYKLELERLKKKINRLLASRNREIEALKAELNKLDDDVIGNLEPFHPENVLPNGRLSKRGISCCHRLFTFGLSDMAVSHLMRISYSSISKRRKGWKNEET